MTRKQSGLTLFKRLMLQAKPFWPHVGVLFLIGLFQAPLALLMPYLIKLAEGRATTLNWFGEKGKG